MGQPQKIRIAITGGGIAGATLLRALLTYPHLDVHIFEAAPMFKEAGASIGISSNAFTALELIGPSTVDCLDRAGAFKFNGFIVKLAVGEDQGRIVGKAGERGIRSVARADFLRELLADAPPERMHTSKKLDSLEEGRDDSLTLCFTDGSTHECDILVGADGVRSTVRKLVLGEDSPAANPQNSGWWAVWGLRPYAEAKSHLDINKTHQQGYFGDGTFLMHSILDGGQTVSFALTGHDEDAGGRYNRPIFADEIRRLFQGWPPHLLKAIDEMICDKPEQSAFYIWEHAVPASTYVKGSICLIGDAAHAMTPWQASGGAMSIEDALILSTLLGRVRATHDAKVALRVYDEVRRPRTQQVVESSRGTGLILTGRGEETGLDPKLLEEKLSPRWDFIHKFDVKRHHDEAIGRLDVKLAQESCYL